MEDWKEYKLGDIGTIVGGATPSTKDSSNYDGNIAWITPKDLSNLNCRYISHGERMISQKGFDDCSCRMLPKNSILFSSRAPIGYVAIAQNALCTNQGFKSIIPNNEIVDSLFLYYLLVYYKPVIENMGSGTTFKEVSGSVMKALTVNIPNIDKQKRIAAILSSLDDKIELNRRINGNLEQQAQALFKAWFVDFEPFKDGKFVDSELGKIPEDWRVSTIEELCQHIASGSTPSSMNKEYYDGNIKWFTTKELNDTFLLDSEKHISEKGHQSSSTKMFPTGTVLMAIYAAPTVGRLGILTSNATFNQAAVGLTPKQKIGSYYIFLLLKNERNNFNNLAIGAAQQNLSVKFVKTYTTIIPPEKVICDFNIVINPIFDRIKFLNKEISSLTNLRDTLLPKLMSGKLKIE